MFTAFEVCPFLSPSETTCDRPPPLPLRQGPPRIVRLFGKGRTFFRGSPEYDTYLPEASGLRMPGSRAVVLVDVFKVGSSCGYSIPFYEYLKDR